MSIARVSYDTLYQDSWITSKLMYNEPEVSFKTKLLVEVCDINSSDRRFSYEDFEKTDFELIELTSINKDNNMITKTKELTKENYTSKASLKAYKNDLIYPLIQVSKSSRLLPSFVGLEVAALSSNFAVIVPKEDSYYLLWALEQDYVIDQIKANYTGALISRISISSLKEIKIPWLNEEERKEKSKLMKQRFEKLVEESSKLPLDTKVNKLLEKYYNLKTYDQTSEVKSVSYNKLYNDRWDTEVLLDDEIVIFNGVDMSKVKKLKDVCASIEIGINVSKFRESATENLIIKSINIEPFIMKGKLKQVEFNEKMADKKGDFSVREGDILTTIKGRVGITAIVTEGYEGYKYDDFLVRIRVDEKCVNPYYLVAYMNSLFSKKLLSKYIKNTTMKYITLSDLVELQIYIPNLQEQERFLKEL